MNSGDSGGKARGGTFKSSYPNKVVPLTAKVTDRIYFPFSLSLNIKLIVPARGSTRVNPLTN